MTNPDISDFHCASRGVRETDLYVDDQDRRAFLRFLDHFAPAFEIVVAAFVLMGNHFHMIVRATRGNLGLFFHSLHMSYAKYLNARHGYRGHVFQSDFRPYEIRSPAHLIAASIYTDINPVKDFGFHRPEDYPFSSRRLLLNPAERPRWLDPTPVLERLSPDRAVAEGMYAALLEQRIVVARQEYGRSAGARATAEPMREFTSDELGHIIQLLHSAAARYRATNRLGIPSEALVLAAAHGMKLRSLSALGDRLGISRKKARAYLETLKKKGFATILESAEWLIPSA